MEKPLKLATVVLTALLAAISFIHLVKPQVPPIPMTIDGYVLVRRVDGTNRTVPAGLAVYAKEGTKIINVEDPQKRWITGSNGYFVLGASASSDGVLIDLWVENINVTRVIFRQGAFLKVNLTVIDGTLPTIQIISPQSNEILPPNQPTWINATVKDNFVLDSATITLTLNGTALTPNYNPETGLVYCKTSPLPSGRYTVNLSVKDWAGNLAAKTWNFAAASSPTITITSPTAANPKFTQSAQTLSVTYRYTEGNPRNATIRAYNSTHTVVAFTITVGLTGGTNIQRTDNITIPAGTADGNYNLDVTIFNIYGLSATATQMGAIKVDNTKPVISNPYQNPPGQVVQPGSIVEVQVGFNITVKVSVTELNIEKVSLIYNISATQWTEIPMNPTTGNEYTATIAASRYPPCTTIQYYVKAVDKAGNTAQTPTAGVYFVFHIIPEHPKIASIAALLAITLTTLAKKKRRKLS
ncbi:MAG: hypothetical protein NZ932_03095 [Candidatus Bathyarchaeota archaeon]|nr:hypothetical protein [Candidatus Bathyarchaeota archaeon]